MLIEIECGTYIQGRNNRAASFIADAVKYLEASLAEWSVARLTAEQINAPLLVRLAGEVSGRSGPSSLGV